MVISPTSASRCWKKGDLGAVCWEVVRDVMMVEEGGGG